jgi:hypothetical protein
MRKGTRCAQLLCAVAACAPRPAAAATYAVGPARAYADLQAVAPLLRPGDRVEIDGAFTYPGGVILREPGRKDAKITIAGRLVNGKRPVLAGGATTLELRGGHYVIEGLEITGGTSRCLFHHADDVTVRDTVVHDCPGHGILGADDATGSLTLSYVEVYRAGRGDGAHPIYVAGDEESFPRSVFRMEHCFVHDALGGNSVKSRAERNEIYGNWIEGALYHELELIGPDGAERKRAREDSDVVGNVLWKRGPGYAVRVGGDGSGESNGRYRFVNNTIVLGAGARAAFRLFNGLESIVMHNNALAREGGGGLRVLVEDDVRWAAGRPVIAGTNNWIPMGSSGLPPQWAGTLVGRDPGFVSARDPRPAPGSPLIGAGASALPDPPQFDFPAPLVAQRELPPQGALERVGTARQRLRGSIDIGAFSYGVESPGAPPVAPPRPPRGCGCGSAASVGAAPVLGALAASLAGARRRSRRGSRRGSRRRPRAAPSTRGDEAPGRPR